MKKLNIMKELKSFLLLWSSQVVSSLGTAMTEYAFASLGCSAVYGRVVHGNGASARVLEKGGYTFVREEFGAEDDPYGNGMLVYIRKSGR